MELLDLASKHVFYPLWDLRDRSTRLAEWRAMEKQQWWPQERIEILQRERLKALMQHAAKESPWYREVFTGLGIDPGASNVMRELKKLPVTTKQDIRNHTDQFICKSFDRDALVRAKTGGSTGVSLNLFFDTRCQERRNAAQLMADRWAGWDLGMKRAAVWGNPPVPITLKEKARQHLHDRMIYLDTMDLNERSMGEFVRLWRKEKPGAIFGHAHSIYIFSRYLLDQGILDLRPKAVVATSMMLLEHERSVIEQALSCKVTNRYGCEEVGLIACECDHHQGMHLNILHLVVEFLDENDQPVPPGQPGKVVVTDLNNFAMPLIRYRVEDVGVPAERKCNCGRGLPLMEKLEGRVADFLIKPDGGRVAGISLVERTLTKVAGVEQMQLVQETRNLLIVNRVKGTDFHHQTDSELISELRQVFDDRVEISLRNVQRIPQEASGKYRFSICKVQ